jgi:hypothetical protein
MPAMVRMMEFLLLLDRGRDGVTECTILTTENHIRVTSPGIQQAERMRRIGVLINRAADNKEGRARLAAFQQALQELGWSDGRNVRIDIRWGADDVDRERKYAAELVALMPDIILAGGSLRRPVPTCGRLCRSLPQG